MRSKTFYPERNFLSKITPKRALNDGFLRFRAISSSISSFDSKKVKKGSQKMPLQAVLSSCNLFVRISLESGVKEL